MAGRISNNVILNRSYVRQNTRVSFWQMRIFQISVGPRIGKHFCMVWYCMVWHGMVWYGKFLPPVTPTQNQSSTFSFELLKLLVDLSYTKTFFRFAVIKAVGYKGKLVHLYLLENFNFIESIRPYSMHPKMRRWYL